jgi:hypothetical protein
MIHTGLVYHEVASWKPFFNSLGSTKETSAFQEKAIRAYMMILAASVQHR